MNRIRMKVTAALAVTTFVATGAAIWSGCSVDTAADPLALGVTEAEQTSHAAGKRSDVVEVTIREMDFVAPDEIQSGWTTFRFKNTSGMIHFVAIERLPEGVTEERQQAEVAPVFQEGMNLLNEGDFDAAMAAFGRLPAWFGEIVFMGGPGLTSAGITAETTVYLEPGTYLLECYVKTNGIFHSYNPDPNQSAMVHELVVTDEASGASEPKATIDLTISSERGIEVDGDVRPGRHTVAVHFEDQIVHEHFLGHDVNLVRLDDATQLDELATWMNWTLPTGLETPAPAIFLGGVQEMPAGSTGYFNVRLKPGSYAWIAEVPNPQEKQMLKTFTIPATPQAER